MNLLYLVRSFICKIWRPIGRLKHSFILFRGIQSSGMSMLSIELSKDQIIAKEICAKITNVRKNQYGFEIAEKSGNAIMEKLTKQNKIKLAAAVKLELKECHNDIMWAF